jgi:glutathione-independent formaldehyde dehydrogenase
VAITFPLDEVSGSSLSPTRDGYPHSSWDPGAATEDAKQSRYGFNYGLVFDKAISMGHGQCPVKRYNHQLRDLIIRGKAQSSLIVSHDLPLDQVSDAYARFNQREDGWPAHTLPTTGNTRNGS